MWSLLPIQLNELNWTNVNSCLRENSHNIELWVADKTNSPNSNVVNLIRSFSGAVSVQMLQTDVTGKNLVII